MSTTPVTAVLHHNREEWTRVHGDQNNYEAAGSFNGQVGFQSNIGYDLLRITSENDAREIM